MGFEISVLGDLVETQSENPAVVGGQAIEGLIAATLLKCDMAKIIAEGQSSHEVIADCLYPDMLVAATTLQVEQQIAARVMTEVVAEDTPAQAITAETPEALARVSETPVSPTVLGSQSFAAASRDLVNIMTLPSGQAQPQERLFAGDALVGILPHLPPSELTNLARTVARLDLVSGRLRTFLVTHHDTDISCRMLKDAHNIADVDLLKLVPTATEQQLRLIARRRLLGIVVCDAIVDTGNTAAILDLLRNPESRLTDGSFLKLMKFVDGNNDLESAFCNRADLPQAIGLQMFWQVNRNLRRYLLSRFLTESAALGRVMEVGMAAGAIPPFGGHASSTDIELLVSQIEVADPYAAATLARCCRIAPETAARIVNDPGGEPLAVVFKSLAQSRLAMAQALKRWLASSKCAINGENRLIELHAQFDGLSFNKARMLLAYWDWSSREAGPFTALSS
jgi:hypothetical protein